VLKDTWLSDEEEEMPHKKSQHVLKGTRLSDEEEMPHKKSQHYQEPTNKGVYNLLDVLKDTWLSDEEMPHKKRKKSWHHKFSDEVYMSVH